MVVNAGSSTLKLRLLGPGDEVEAAHDVDPWAGDADPSALEPFAEAMRRADAAGHRVVHGGPDLREPTVLDDDAVAAIEALTPLAPLHQPRALAGIRAVQAALPGVPAVACFDTAFHATLPAAAATYALPEDWRRRWPLRRFGFHGLSHQHAVRRSGDMLGRVPARMVTCHLGAGASLCAVLEGRSVDTTMGFTPLEGLVMNTRSGSIDPGLVLWLVNEAGLAPAAVADGLERHSGLAGLSGTSGDLREIGAGTLAFDVYVHRLRREIAAMAAALGGLDALVFTGGVGEHQPAVRAAAGAGLGFLGVDIDEATNAGVTGDGEIGAGGAPVRTLVVTAREDLEISRQVRDLLG